MLTKKSFSLVFVLSMVLIVGLFSSSVAADWQPSGPIKMMIAFKAGGGADTQARLIAEELQARHGWKFIPTQVTGKGGLNLAKALKKAPNDGTTIGITVSETLGYNMVAAKKSGIKLKDFTALTTTAGFEMGIVSLSKKGWKTFHDVIKAAKGGQKIRFGAMSPRLADIAYLLGKNNNVDFNIVMVKGGKGVMNGLNAGDIDVGFVAGIQAKAVAAGDMVNLASGRSKPLKQSPDAPLIKEFGVAYPSDGYFIFVAPAGLPDETRMKISDAIAEVVSDKSTKAGGFLEKAFGGAAVMTGAELDRYLTDELKSAQTLLKEASE
jgi:tripartite-type tricarboxylate transporter receptor subunit TctC